MCVDEEPAEELDGLLLLYTSQTLTHAHERPHRAINHPVTLETGCCQVFDDLEYTACSAADFIYAVRKG